MSEPVAEPTAPPSPAPWWKTTEGSTGRLMQLCAGYFTFYAITGVMVKYFIGKPADGFIGMNDVSFLAYNTLGGTSVCLGWVLLRGWYRLKSTRLVTWGRVTFPSELLYIIPSGVCTAIVIPTTTMMYMLPISVMVAMVIMRASVIIISRVVDALQIAQGILHRRVYIQEEIAVGFAISAVALQVFTAKEGDFDFAQNPIAMSILGSYIVAYAFRIYIMNYFKNTRGKGVPLDNNGFFAIEQIAAAAAMAAMAAVVFFSPALFTLAPVPASGKLPAEPDFATWYSVTVHAFRGAVTDLHPLWIWAALAGVVYGCVAFVSVFIFMFKGRTATFAGLVNRLTSLVAGTASTLIVWLVFHGKPPKSTDWYSLGLILVAVGFLTLAERRRAKELTAAPEAAKGQ